MSESTYLKLPYIEEAQAQKHVTHNEAIRKLDAIVQIAVIDRDLTAPPGAPVEGDRYIPAAPATSDWTGHENEVAAWLDGAWAFFAPQEGWLVWPVDEQTLLIWNGAAWVDFTSHLDLAGGALQLLGINGAVADATNRLAVETPSVLFNREADTINLTLNKQAAADDARLTLQTAFSTRALLGLLGSDDFTVQVSPDGAQFFPALAIDKDTGNVAIGAGSDANNKLLVSGESMLFTNNGDLRFTFSKGADGNDCALTFQSNFSARALFGLLGNNDFAINVSDDGAGFDLALVIDHQTAAARFPEHPKFSAFLNFGQNYTAGAWQDLLMNNTRHNDQGDVAINTNVLTFTAPHDGYYMFGIGATFENPGTTPSKMQVGLSINGANPAGDTIGTAGDAALVSGETQCAATALLKLGAGDTVNPMIFFTGANGRVLADENYFWGAQVA